MPQRPIILHVGAFDDMPEKQADRESAALSLFLRLHWPMAEVIEWRFFGEPETDLAQHWQRTGELRLVVVSGERRSRDSDAREADMALGNTPILLMDGPSVDLSAMEKHQTITVFKDLDEPLMALVDGLIASWRPLDWLGWAGTLATEQIGCQTLKRWHALDCDGRELVEPDDNHRIVAAALRLRLLPCSLLAEAYDQHLPEEQPSDEAVSTSAYEQACEATRRMSDEERQELLDNLARRTWGEYLGTSVRGLAIELTTGQIITTSGEGLHGQAAHYLLVQTESFMQMDHKSGREQHRQYYIVSGWVVHSCPGLSLPVAFLGRYDWEKDEPVIPAEKRRQAAYILRRDGRFLPIDHEGRLVEP
jgi:hypothetical protein